MNRLLDLQRYRACRSIFRRPARAHLALAFATKRRRRDDRPQVLDFLDGGCLGIPYLGRWKRFWDRVLAKPERFSPIGVQDHLLYVHYQGVQTFLRPDQLDVDIFKETHFDDVYGLTKLSSDLGTVVDIGANTGLFSMRVAGRAKRVLAVEPVPDNVRVLKRNLQAAAGKGTEFALVSSAVTAQSGNSVALYLSDASGGAHSLSEDWAAAHSRAGAPRNAIASTLSLEDLLSRYGVEQCDLLKCDAEGAEYEIFEGCPLAVLGRIRRIVMEVHRLPGAFEEGHEHALIRRLEAAGFTVQRGDTRRRRRSSVEFSVLSAAR